MTDDGPRRGPHRNGHQRTPCKDRVFRQRVSNSRLISLSMLMPVYPVFYCFPLIDIPWGNISEIFIFVFMTLFLAAVVVCIWALVSAIYHHGREKGKAFGSYRIDIAKAEASFVWPMEDVVGGQVVSLKKIPYDEEKEIMGRLKDAGCETVSVTPMIPFMIPVAIASVFLVFVGNPLFII